MKDFPINRGMFKNSRSDHEATLVNIIPGSQRAKLTKPLLTGKAQSWVPKKYFMKNTRDAKNTDVKNLIKKVPS